MCRSAESNHLPANLTAILRTSGIFSNLLGLQFIPFGNEG
jgi:hypothetical protein